MACVENRMYVTVPVTALWTSARAPRDIDGPAVAEQPDVEAWLALLDDAVPQGRLGLHGRVLTQLERGEPVLVLDRSEDGWAEVVCPWQPSSLDARGYPGWVPLSHLGAERPADAAAAPDHATDGTATTPRVEGTFLEQAGRHVGLRYLWGGMSAEGLDCSGLVHRAMRELGVVVPRDADDQHDACEPVPLEQVRPGDLYFFAREGRRAHHVGIVTAPGRMLHAPENDGLGVILEQDLDADRLATLAGAGRFPGAPHTS
ncbi:hypothetical protein GCM10009657_06520 [Oryzihumus leptocrescens]